jgi:hypothetical protein
MKRFAVIFGLALSLMIGANMAAPNSAFALFGPSKQAISKSCSKQADKKGLHGKARKAFRAKCKRHGGKVT